MKQNSDNPITLGEIHHNIPSISTRDRADKNEPQGRQKLPPTIGEDKEIPTCPGDGSPHRVESTRESSEFGTLTDAKNEAKRTFQEPTWRKNTRAPPTRCRTTSRTPALLERAQKYLHDGVSGHATR